MGAAVGAGFVVGFPGVVGGAECVGVAGAEGVGEAGGGEGGDAGEGAGDGVDGATEEDLWDEVEAREGCQSDGWGSDIWVWGGE